MDDEMIHQAIRWVEQQFDGRTTISREELQKRAETSGLPEDAKNAMGNLPPGQLSQGEIVGRLRDMMMQRVGAVQGRFGGGFGSQGGQGGGTGGGFGGL